MATNRKTEIKILSLILSIIGRKGEKLNKNTGFGHLTHGQKKPGILHTYGSFRLRGLYSSPDPPPNPHFGFGVMVGAATGFVRIMSTNQYGFIGAGNALG